jgi:Arc/MetJ-type ribon-helix-helix transcriptional regulator
MARRSKGDRAPVLVRVPPEHLARFDAEVAASRYKNRSDYLAAFLAQHHDLPLPDWLVEEQEQEDDHDAAVGDRPALFGREAVEPRVTRMRKREAKGADAVHADWDAARSA